MGAAAKAFRADADTFATLSVHAKKYADTPGPGLAAKGSVLPGPLAHFDDADKLLPSEPPRAKNFNFKLANVERATGLRIAARVFAKSPPPPKMMRPENS